MNRTMASLTFYFFCIAINILDANTTEPSAMQPGRLIILLHEAGPLGQENSIKKEIGAVTMRAATAIAQKAGIIIMSPAIWANLLTRIDWFQTEMAKKGSLVSLFNTAWQHNLKTQSIETHTQLQALSNLDKSLIHHLYLFTHKPLPTDWLCFHHTDASLIILVPKEYVAKRHGLVPRSLPTTYGHDDYATGIKLSQCAPIALPQTTLGLQKLVNHATHLRKRSTFSLTHFESLFIERRALHPLLCIPWNIYMVGHGTYKNTVCGLTAADFSTFLQWCNKELRIQCFYYQSCYGGDHHDANDIFTQTAGSSLHFPLIAGAIGQAPVHALMPRKGTIMLTTDTFIDQFFEALERNESSWETILSPITPIISTPQDVHSISNTPLLLSPRSTQLQPIDVSTNKKVTGDTTAHIIRAGIIAFTARDQLAALTSNESFVVRGKRALIIMPKIISRPLEIHPYQHVKRNSNSSKTTFIPPAILSLSAGNGIHQCAKLTTHSINLKDFLTQSFLQLTKQKGVKIFLFDELTIDNDLSTNFTSEKTSFWQTITTTARRWLYGDKETLDSPQITLHKVLVMLNNHRLTCIFLEPCKDNQTRARKIVYYRPPTTQKTLPLTLDIHTISLHKHAGLYKKYVALRAK